MHFVKPATLILLSIAGVSEIGHHQKVDKQRSGGGGVLNSDPSEGLQTPDWGWRCTFTRAESMRCEELNIKT